MLHCIGGVPLRWSTLHPFVVARNPGDISATAAGEAKTPSDFEELTKRLEALRRNT